MNGRSFSTLLISPNQDLLRRGARFLEICGYAAITANSYERGAQLLAIHSPDFLLLDPGNQRQAAFRLARQARERKDGGQTYTLLLVDQPGVPELLEALQAGCDDFLAHPVSFGEWLARLKSGARALEFDRRLAQQRGTDVLTNFQSRAAFERNLGTYISKPGRETTCSLLLLRPDGGDRMQQHLGSAAYDLILQQAARQVRELAPRASLCARWDDVTLAIFLPGEIEDQAAARAEQWRSSLGNAEITWSAGIADWKPGQEAIDWVQRSKQSLELAAQSGGSCTATGRQCAEANDAWSVDAAAGRLFATTTARDVMSLCPLVLFRDETTESAAALLRQTSVTMAPVVDESGHFVGMFTIEGIEARSPRFVQGKQSGSVPLLRHYLTTDVPKFDAHSGLAELLDFFGADPQPFGVVLSECRPIGIIHCESLACLSERLTPESLSSGNEPAYGSEYLVIPEVSVS